MSHETGRIVWHVTKWQKLGNAAQIARGGVEETLCYGVSDEALASDERTIRWNASYTRFADGLVLSVRFPMDARR